MKPKGGGGVVCHTVLVNYKKKFTISIVIYKKCVQVGLENIKFECKI